MNIDRPKFMVRYGPTIFVDGLQYFFDLFHWKVDVHGVQRFG